MNDSLLLARRKMTTRLERKEKTAIVWAVEGA